MEGQNSSDRPDLSSWVFRGKLMDLKGPNSQKGNLWKGFCFCICDWIPKERPTTCTYSDNTQQWIQNYKCR